MEDDDRLTGRVTASRTTRVKPLLLRLPDYGYHVTATDRFDREHPLTRRPRSLITFSNRDLALTSLEAI